MPNIQEKVFQNSLQTCNYISGYKNASSVIKVKCFIHDYEFETKYENVRRDNRKHHICPLCQQEDKIASRIEIECAYCKKKIFRAPSKLENSKSGLYFCCREHKDKAQMLNTGNNFNDIRPEHYGNGKNYRDKAFREYPNECSVCGWNEDIDILEVHHIDENRENNEIDNLILLCPICHRKLTNHKYVLISRNKIERVV